MLKLSLTVAKRHRARNMLISTLHKHTLWEKRYHRKIVSRKLIIDHKYQKPKLANFI